MKKSLPIVLALACLAFSGLLSNTALFQQPVRTESDLTRNIPEIMGSWVQIAESRPTEAEYAGLETRDIIKRTYSDGKHLIELVVAYIARSNRKSAHAQEACLRGAGAFVGTLESVHMSQAPVQATMLSIDHHNRRSWVYYWYKIGETYTSQYLKSSVKMFLGGLFGEKARGAALVRLLTPESRGETLGEIQVRMEDFTKHLLPQLEEHLP